MYGRPYLNTTAKVRRSFSLFKINFGTMESETPPPPLLIQKRQCSTASALLSRDYANGTNS